MTFETLAVIPARGGSIGIPRKNLCLLAGKPLITFTINQALGSDFINRIVVSTDDPEIAEVSNNSMAEVVWRPKEISGPDAKSEDAILYTLEFLSETEGYKPDLLVFLQCTSPLTSTEDIDGTVKALIEACADSALSVTPFHYFLWRQNENGSAIGINHDKTVRQLRQNKEPQYLETGAVYAMRYQGFIQAKHRFFGKTVFYIMPQERCLEIDDPVDLRIAEVLMKK